MHCLALRPPVRSTPTSRPQARARRLWPGLLSAAAAFSGCGADDTGDGGAGGVTADAAASADGDRPADDFAIGRPRMGADGALQVTIRQGTPAPPARDLNDWVIEVTDADGQPQGGCTLAVGLFMPAHGHTSTTEPVVAASTPAGTYTVEDMNLFMPGRWEITFDLVCGALSDQVLFGVEIPR
jgi:hypothetical protein